MRKKEKKNKIIKLREENEEYKKEINDLYLKIKELTDRISDNDRKIEQYENEILIN